MTTRAMPATSELEGSRIGAELGNAFTLEARCRAIKMGLWRSLEADKTSLKSVASDLGHRWAPNPGLQAGEPSLRIRWGFGPITI